MSSSFKKEINGYLIDPRIFTQTFVNCCDISKCSGECCYYGVYTDKKESDNILEMKDKVINAMDDSQTKDVSKWFEAPEVDEDFDSGIAVGTELYNGKCVFLDKEGFCTLQKMAMSESEFKWKYKPLYCILFPLVIYNGAITIDDEHLDRMHYCNLKQNQESTFFEACSEELEFLLGKKGMTELKKYRNSYLKNGEETVNDGKK